MTDGSPPFTELDARLVQSTLVACGTLLVYDYICTVDREVRFVWLAPRWSLGTVLFFLNRYLPFVDTFLSLKLKLSWNSPETCKVRFAVVTWFIVTGILISEFILVLRTYALWERTRFIKIVLTFSYLATLIPAVIITEIEIRSLRYIENDRPGCRLEYASPIIIVAYILLVLSETLMAGLTAIKAYRHSYSPSAWVKQLIRDGLIFYAYVLLISIANVLVPVFAPRVFVNWLATPQRVLHSVLCNRVLLLILKQRASTNMTARADEPDHLTSFADESTNANLTIVNTTRSVYSSGSIT